MAKVKSPKTTQDTTAGAKAGPIILFLVWLALLITAAVYFFVQPPEVGFFTEAQVRTGVIAYSQHCASCHGADLQGISAPALIGVSFLESWEGRSVAALYDYTHNQMPLGRGGSLSDETYAETVAYVLQQNGLPSGDIALEPDAPHLRELVIRGDAAQEDTSFAPVDQAQSDLPQMQEPQVMLVQDTTPSTTPFVPPVSGQHVYERHCSNCHGADGGGGIGPALVNNPRLEDAAWTIRRIAIGGLGMPAFAQQLSSAEIAEVTSYIRTNFNNAYGAVTAEAVQEVVAGLESDDVQPVTNDLAAAPLGQERYVQLCSACHGLQGGGGVGPPLAGNANLDNTQLVVPTILYGRGQMPAFSLHSNLEIAEIASYIRTAWGNDYGPVSPEVVETYRPETRQASASSALTSPASQDTPNNAENENTTSESSANEDTTNQNSSQNPNESQNGASQNNSTENQTGKNSSGQSETTNTEGGSE
jgi:mono/diheme cytochrome c family protein